MSKPNIGQTTDLYLRLKVTVPQHLSPVFADEFLMKMKTALMAKAEEVSKEWDAKVDIIHD